MKIKLFNILLIILILVIIIATIATLYNSDSEIPIKDRGHASIAITGDVLIGNKVEGILSSGESPLRYVSNVTNETDILLINFESAATDSNNAVKGDYPFKVATSNVHFAKFNKNNTVASIANNHVFDYGVDGMRDTIKSFDANGIYHIGAGENISDATHPITFEVDKHKITILNYMDADDFSMYGNEVIPPADNNTPGFSPYSSSLAKSQIQEAKNNGSDFVLVYFHYGNEYSKSPNQYQINMSRECIDLGADMVVGNHPHVAQGVETYKGKPIFYSLGNFVFYELGGDSNRDLLLKVDLDGDNATVTVYPVFLSDFIPHFMDASSGKSFLSSLSPLSDDLVINSDGTGQIHFKLE